MANEQEAKYTREEDADLVSYGANPQTGFIELVRRWNVSRADLRASILTYLNATKTVTNPKADKKSFPGVFRVMANQEAQKKGLPEDQQGITQTLRLLVSNTFGWDASESTLDNQYAYFYQNLSAPIHAVTPQQGLTTDAKNTLNDNLLYDADSALSRSHPYQWTTHTSENARMTGDDIGYKNFLTRPQAPVSTAQGTVYDAKSTLNRDGTYDGGVGYKTSKAIVFGERSETALATGYDLTYLASRTFPVHPAGTVQGTLYNAKSTINSDETYDGGVGYKTSKAIILEDRNESVLASSYDLTYLASRTRPAAPTTTVQGTLYNAKSTINEDDTYGGGVGYRTSKPLMFEKRNESALATTIDLTYLAYRTDPSAPASTVQGTLYNAKSTINEDETYNGGVGYKTSKPVVLTDVIETALATSYNADYLASRTRPVAPASTVQGTLYNAKSTLNEDDTYGGGVGYRTSKPVVLTDVLETALATSYNADYLASRTRPVAPASTVQGTLYNAKSTINEDETYNGGVGYRTSKAIILEDRNESVLASAYDLTYLASRTRPAAPVTTVQGTIYNAKSSLNEDETYNGGVGYKTSKPVQIASRVNETAFTIGYSVDYMASRTIPAIPADTVQGTLYDTKSSLNEDETYNGGIGYQYAKQRLLEFNWTSEDGQHYRQKFDAYRDLPAAVAALTGSTDNDVDVEYMPNNCYQVRISKDPARFAATGGAVIATLDPVTFYRRQYRFDMTEYRTMTITMTIRMTTSRDIAYTFITGGMDASKVERNGNTYVATKYTATFSAWDAVPEAPAVEAAIGS